MNVLKEIKDHEIEDGSLVKVRMSSRAVLFDEDGLIPILFVSKHNYHKLPGGGIVEGESITDGLLREVVEEVGSQIMIEGEIGKVIEFRKKFNLKQISYCYFGRVLSKGKPNFTSKEISQGFQLVWLTIDDAIQKLKTDRPESYEGSFIKKRDLIFLQKAKRMRIS